ncbi:MAG: hypothetical protein KC766_02175 [Myxococcales bacterium]|nr:hypothetical protein [Myxococcales bacterium]
MLRSSHWELGQDARLREDLRFRQTPWGRWMRAEDLLGNDALHRELHAQRRGSANLNKSLDVVGGLFGRRCVFCPGDPRFVLQGDEVRLAASELSRQPVIEDEVGDLERYTTHLPVHSLKAAAASEPAGEWGPDAQEQMIETLGWIRVSSRRRLNSRMFVAQIEGHSMDDGRSGLVDGGYAIFELWPSGTKQLLSVLVRGSFRDPETGSYAVKKYVADQRDAEGRHHQINLVSLNPDKERYPDIELQVEDEEALTVVAKVIQPLSPDEYARRPKPLRRKGRRDLDNEDALERVHERLSERASRFFEAQPAATENEEEQPDTSVWNSQVVCLDAGSGGLHLEIGPLIGLWKFVKVLVARAATGETKQTLASNARLRPVRVAVLASDGAWTWGAEGFEDDPDVDLSALDVPGVPTDRVSAFRVGADGVGKLLSGDHLSPGQAYRLLVPSEVWESVDCSMPTSELSDGWHLAELALPSEPRPELVDDLEKLGFRLGDLTPSLSFALASWPDEWRSTLRGEGFATFAAGENGSTSVLVSVDGYEAEVDDEAQLFVHGPGGPRRVSLPAGSTATVELSGLSTGQYFCTLLHQRTRVQPAHLPFEVAADLAAPPDASLGTNVAGESTAGAPNTVTRAWRGDLALLAQDEVAVEGPPGWAVRVLWREVTDDYLATLELDATGQLDVPRLFSLTRERRERRLLGDLVLDCGELGSLVLEHERHATVQGVGSVLGELARTKGDFVRRRAGAFTQLLPMWFEPVGQCLGYEVETVAELPEEPPVHAAAARLLVTERRADGIGRRCKRVLVMLEELQAELGEELLDWIDGVCLRFGVDNALISTGLSWAEHRRRSRLPLKVWELDEVLAQDELLIAFLRDVAEGV